MTMRRIVFCLLSTLWLPVVSGQAAAPRVVSLSVRDGQTDVATTLTAITVRFDRPMRTSSLSFTGGGSTFPPVAGQIGWVDATTCRMPVKLAPDHYYLFGLNSAAHTGFRSAQGVVLPPRLIEFTTAPAGAGLSRAVNERALAALRKAVDTGYSYRDLRQVDWPARFTAARDGLLGCRGKSGFALRTARLLSAARDLHVWVKLGNQGLATFRRNVAPNWNGRGIPRLVPGFRQHNRVVFSARTTDGIGYLMVTTWNRGQAAAVRQALVALKQLTETGIRALVVDVRPNSGGAEMLARELAGCFTDTPVDYARHVTRDPSAAGGFSGPFTRTLQPNPKGPRFKGPVAVLSGPTCLSSCEAFLLMAKALPTCEVIGERSYGSSGNPRPHDLGNGVIVYLPSWKALRLDGSVVEGQGVAPDREVRADPAALRAGRDPILTAALARLRERLKE